MRWYVLVMAMLTIAGCKKDREQTQQAAAEAALGDEWVALYGEYAAAIEKNSGDCEAAAEAVRKLNFDREGLLARGRPEQAKLEVERKQEIGAALDRMAPTLDRCRPTPAFMAALKAGPFGR